MTLERGSLLHKRYRIVEILGQGGMGSVYRAVDENTGINVAVKENRFITDEYARQFRLEAVVLANMRYPNLPRVTDHFVIGDQGQYLIMDYIEGENLGQRIKRIGNLTEDETILLGAAICDTLTYLHSRKPPILHRDIKPGNVKITPDGHIFLVDFGLAKVLHGSQATNQGARARTPGFSPPEQYGAAQTYRSADVYSLGATLYAALSGTIPEDGLARGTNRIRLTPLRSRNNKVSRRLAAVVEKAMAIDPAARFQNADDFKRALLSFKSGRMNLSQDLFDNTRMTFELGTGKIRAIFRAFKRTIVQSKPSQSDLPPPQAYHDTVPTLDPETILHGRYRIGEILGKGNMGTVYHAQDISLESVDVAIKENLLRGDSHFRQFHREAVILAKLQHPNLPRVSNHFVIGDYGQYLVMDYIGGEDLNQRMQRTKNITEDEAILIGATICETLTYLHTHKPPVLHRDIKPANIKITANNKIYLVDFGLMKLMSETDGGIDATTTGAQGIVPGYSPPEQYRLTEQYRIAHTDHRSDIYSLGATLYAALSGVIPEDGFDRAMEIRRLMPLRKQNSEISEGLVHVIEKAMSIDPADRFQTAKDFHRALLASKTIPVRLKVFICHASEDKSTAENLYSRLGELGLSPWLDQKNLAGGEDWKLEIEKAVEVSDAVVILLSKNSVKKEGFIQKELKQALEKAEEKPEGTIFLIPLRLDECEVPQRLKHLHWVNYFDQDGHERLINSLKLRAISLQQQGN